MTRRQVDRIQAQRLRHGNLEYLVKWDNEASWESQRLMALQYPLLVEQFHELDAQQVTICHACGDTKHFVACARCMARNRRARKKPSLSLVIESSPAMPASPLYSSFNNVAARYVHSQSPQVKAGRPRQMALYMPRQARRYKPEYNTGMKRHASYISIDVQEAKPSKKKKRFWGLKSGVTVTRTPGPSRRGSVYTLDPQRNKALQFFRRLLE